MKEITVIELKEKLDNGEDIQIIDIREDWEVDCATLGGQNIPMGEIISRLNEISQEIPVVIHCKGGDRSSKMIQYLETNYQYDNLYNLTGGIKAWAEQVDCTLKID